MNCRMQADSFYNAFLVLRENDQAIGNQMQLAAQEYNKTLPEGQEPIHSIQVPNMRFTLGVDIVCLAFAVELYIKDIHLRVSGYAPKGHKIIKLFESLPEEVQTEILRIHSIEQYGWTMGAFKKMITVISDGFENWRYSYETNNLSYQSGFATEFINSLKRLRV